MGKAAAKVSEFRAEQAKTRGHLAIRLFGHVEVALDGDQFRLATPRKSLQVLAYLLLHRGAPVSREYLAFLLYPDDEEGAARAKLRGTLSELPKILPQPAERYVMIDLDKIAWNPTADVWLDVDSFAAAATDRSRLEEAIELYRGDLLPEVYDEWLDAIRERYRNAYLRCLTERVSEARSNANLALAIETARKVLAVDPWREDMVRRIIAMRYESGDRAGALSEYAGFGKRLRAEMAADPMAETTAVAERIARGQALDDETGDEERPFIAGSAVLPFVGRREEMERLLETWSRVSRGRGACAFIGGEPGIGKSRIVLELAHAVEDRGGRALVGATSSSEAVPYESVVDALRSALPLVASLKPSMALASIAALLPELHARVTLPEAPRLDGESERIRLFDSLFRCLADLAAQRPLLLVLEDMHLAQPASLELLQFLLRRIPGARIMIVVTYRDDESPQLQALHRLRREARLAAGAQSVWLSRLSMTDVEELRATLPDVRDRAAETLVAASEGNPLFLTQLVVEVREDKGAATPSSLQALVARRIERLSEHARTAAEIAACIGDRFSLDAVREVSAWEETAVTDALDELLDRRIVREAAGRGFLEYAFTHHLVHDAIARGVAPRQAAIRRRRVARVLERLYPERFSELSASLAAHYECAGDVASATRCYLEAVRRSISIGALAEARTHCARALALDAGARARADLLLQSVTIATRSGDLESRNAALLALENVDAELDDPALHRSTLLHRIEFASTTGDRATHERAVGALRECVSDGDMPWNAALHLAEAQMAFTFGHLAESYASGQAALACSRAAQDEAGATRALCALAQVEAHRGHLSAAEALFDEAAQTAARAADPVLEQLALSSGYTIAYQRRDIRRCLELSSRCLELAVKLGDRPAEAQAHGRVAVSLAASGTQSTEVRRHYATAERIYRESGNLAGSGGQLLNQALFEMRLGFFERALAATEKAVELFERASDERGRVGGLSNLIFLRAYTGHIAGAREAAELALERARQLGFGLTEASVLENLAFAEGVAGDYARAIALTEASFELRSRSESQVWSSTTLANFAIWHAALGNLPAAREAVQRLLADDDAIMRATDWPTHCYWAGAQIFRAAGDSAQAASALERARRLMLTTAEELEPADRASFLAIPWHVDLMEAVSHGVWPDPPR
jgi:predicted ATPase/DNA-binding SARP family transcriptional activator